MATFLVLLAMGLILGVFAIQNSVATTLHYGGYIMSGIPLYAVVIGSMLIGVAISWILSLFGWASTAMQLSGKNKTIKQYSQTTHSLEQRVHDLELENERLRTDNKEVRVVHEKEVVDDSHPIDNFITRVRDKIS
jgi:uncharacterized integral membrane protein